MKGKILSYEESKRNSRLKELYANKVKSLLVSGSTGELTEWSVDEIVTNKPNDRDRLVDYEWENTIGKYCDGMTYLEIEQFNNTYNNFR